MTDNFSNLKLQQPSGEDGKSYRDMVYNRILKSRKTGVPTVDYDTLVTNCRELELSHRIDDKKLQEYIQITDQVIELNEQTLNELERRHKQISSALHDQKMREIEHKQEIIDLMYRDISMKKESNNDKITFDDESNDLISWDEQMEKDYSTHNIEDRKEIVKKFDNETVSNDGSQQNYFDGKGSAASREGNKRGYREKMGAWDKKKGFNEKKSENSSWT
ncbi:5236_t:CDS:2 [Dentiscutata erythropus]|uniref:5236_t:CDS:1 n=1 Tax=Dentiscutata erythropus TaxID=1348616 RepID=A0A9N8WK36_9GLOM|nr:5236_t:CDS:2 [Dentiscutata erythropus]